MQIYSKREYLRRIDNSLKKILSILESVGVASVVNFYVEIDGQKQRRKQMFLKITQNLPVAVEFMDKFGNLAQVDGAPVWAVTDPALATLDVAVDGMTATVKPVGAMGSFKVQVSADADMGSGVITILGELSIDLTPGDAVVVNIKAGTPVDAA